MKLFIVAALCVTAAFAAKVCKKGTDTLADETCGDAVTVCSRPLFVEYTGLSADVAYACDACADGTKDKTCEECTNVADATACNTVVETGEDFSCYSYSYNATSTAWEAAAAKVACKRLKATELKCNMPNSTTATTDTYTSNGCGACDATEVNKTCTECSTADCNVSGASRAAFFLLPIAAIVFYFM